jgi:hypothetical protein
MEGFSQGITSPKTVVEAAKKGSFDGWIDCPEGASKSATSGADEG